MSRYLFSRKGTLFITVSLLFLILYSGAYAYAQESLICADDIDKFCKGIRPGGGRLLNCLKSHETDLTESCRGKISELQGIVKSAEEACSGDISQFCREIQPGEGRILKCLREHDKELSTACSAKLETISKRFKVKGEEK